MAAVVNGEEPVDEAAVLADPAQLSAGVASRVDLDRVGKIADPDGVVSRRLVVGTPRWA